MTKDLKILISLPQLLCIMCVVVLFTSIEMYLRTEARFAKIEEQHKKDIVSLARGHDELAIIEEDTSVACFDENSDQDDDISRLTTDIDILYETLSNKGLLEGC